MRGRGAGGATWALVFLALAAAPSPARTQEPEVIVLDPNHPIIQNPRTVPPPAGQTLPPVPAGSPETGPAIREGVNAREVLADLWFKERALQRQGATTEAGRQIETALDFMRREGIRGAPEIAGAFLAEARRYLENGDYRGAQENFRLASRFHPDLAEAHFGLALALLRGDRDVSSAISELWLAVKVRLRDVGGIILKTSNGMLILYLGLCLGVSIALLLSCLHSAPAFFHDLMERYPRRLTEESSRLLGWGLLAIPVLALLPFVWLLAAWAALFFPYLGRTAKFTAVLALVLLFLAGPVGGLLGWVAETGVDPGARALIRSLRGGYDLQDEQALRGLAEEHPDDPMFPFLLGSMHRLAGRFDEAMKMYRRVLELDPRQARAMVNLANLHTLRQEFSIAQNLYKKAGEADPALAIAHYDSHLAHLEAFHLESADVELKAARHINDAQITALMAGANENGARRLPVDTSFTRSEIWKGVLSLRMGEGARAPWWRALTAPATLAGAVGLILAFALPGLGIADRSATARRCLRCGRAFCRRCRVRAKDADHCSQCVHLFILRDGVAPSVKSRKMEEIVRYRRRLWIGERLLSLPLPGSGHVLGGRPWLGLLLLVGWSCAWLGILLRGRLLVSSEAITNVDTGALASLGMFGLLVWLVGNLSTHDAQRE
jgi:tetratricopeptide (TPR) repeat protein